jgi:hypothetical protein
VQVDDAELHFLILHFLASGPCQNAAVALEREAAARWLLPKRIDFEGDAFELLLQPSACVPPRRIQNVAHRCSQVSCYGDPADRGDQYV